MPDRRKDFLKLWVGQTISEIRSRITREGLPLTAVLVLGATPARMGYLAAASSASVLLFSIPARVIADRMCRRPLMIGTDLLRALLLLTIPLAARLGVLSFAQLLSVSVLAGLLAIQFDVAYQSYPPALLTRDELFEGNRRLTISSAAAEILGPGITGVLVQAITAPLAILLDALSFVVSAISASLIRTDTRTATRPRTARLALARGIGRHARRHRQPVIAGACAAVRDGILLRGYVLHALHAVCHPDAAHEHFGPGFHHRAGRRRRRRGPWILKRLTRFNTATVLMSVAMMQALAQCLIPLAASFPTHAVLCMATAQLVGDGAFTIYVVHETTLRQTLIDNRLLGRVNAAVQLASSGILPLGALTGGVLAGTVGIPPTLWVGSAGVLLSCLFLLPLRRNGHPFRINYGNGSGQPLGRETQSGQE